MAFERAGVSLLRRGVAVPDGMASQMLMARAGTSEEAVMEMFLMAAVMSVLGVAVCAALFVAASREDGAPSAGPVDQAALASRRFFASAPDATSPSEPAAPNEAERGQVPVEALLLQIEQHIRLEQAAAESFLHAPTGQSLQSRTKSPHVN
jgi:hypothetical protein